MRYEENGSSDLGWAVRFFASPNIFKIYENLLIKIQKWDIISNEKRISSITEEH